MKNKQKIIIDCDPGLDDALAIVLVVKSQLFDVLAITTVSGNSAIFNTTRNARFVLDQLKSSTPLFSGIGKPLRRKLTTANVQGKDGLGDIKVANTPKLTGNAVYKINKLICKYPNQITVLALGPLSNIAKLLIEYPKASTLIKEIVIMGGAVEAGGNKSKYSEFNFYVDPEAVDLVFKSKIKKVLVPLDVCNKATLELKSFEKFKPSFSYELAKSYQQGLKKYDSIDKIIPYDPLAAYYLINPRAFKTQEMRLSVKTDDMKRGMVYKLNGARNIKVAMDVDAKQFESDFFRILTGGENNDRERF